MTGPHYNIAVSGGSGYFLGVKVKESNSHRGGKTVISETRSDGPLTAEQVAAYRAEGRPLAYDPVQIGWVPADCADDIDMMFKPVPGPRYAKLKTTTGQSYALREWRPSDIEVFHTLLNDAPVWDFMPDPYPDPLTLADAAMLIDVSRHSSHHEVRAVLHGGEPIGQVRLEFDIAEPELAELSYWLGQRYWRQGHGQAMVQQYVDRCFADHPGLQRLTARIRPENTASERILSGAGFAKRRRQSAQDWIWMDKRRG